MWVLKLIRNGKWTKLSIVFFNPGDSLPSLRDHLGLLPWGWLVHTVVVLWPLPGVCEQLKHLSPSVMILAVSGGGGELKTVCTCFVIVLIFLPFPKGCYLLASLELLGLFKLTFLWGSRSVLQINFLFSLCHSEVFVFSLKSHRATWKAVYTIM